MVPPGLLIRTTSARTLSSFAARAQLLAHPGEERHARAGES